LVYFLPSFIRTKGNQNNIQRIIARAHTVDDIFTRAKKTFATGRWVPPPLYSAIPRGLCFIPFLPLRSIHKYYIMCSRRTLLAAVATCIQLEVRIHRQRVIIHFANYIYIYRVIHRARSSLFFYLIMNLFKFLSMYTYYV